MNWLHILFLASSESKYKTTNYYWPLKKNNVTNALTVKKKNCTYICLNKSGIKTSIYEDCYVQLSCIQLFEFLFECNYDI